MTMMRKSLIQVGIIILLIYSMVGVSADTMSLRYSSLIKAEDQIYIGWFTEDLYYGDTTESNSSVYLELGITFHKEIRGYNFTELMADFDNFIDITVNGSQSYYPGLIRNELAVTRLIQPVTYGNGSNELELKAAHSLSDDIKVENNQYFETVEIDSGSSYEYRYYEKDVATGILLNETFSRIVYDSISTMNLEYSMFHEYSLINSSITLGQDVPELDTPHAHNSSTPTDQNSEQDPVNVSILVIPAVLIFPVIRRKFRTNN